MMFLCVPCVLCAVQVMIPSELMLVSLPGHILLFWCVLVRVERDRGGLQTLLC